MWGLVFIVRFMVRFFRIKVDIFVYCMVYWMFVEVCKFDWNLVEKIVVGFDWFFGDIDFCFVVEKLLLFYWVDVCNKD